MYTQIKASWLHTQSYCEHQLYLMVCKDLGAPVTPAILAGRRAHEALNALPDAGEVGLHSLADKIQQAQAKYQPFTVREADVHGTRVYGRIDCLEYHLNHIAISDNKVKPPNGKPYYGDQRQILAYCLAFTEEFPDINMPIIAKLRDYYNKEFWTHEFVEADKVDLNSTIDRILGFLNGTRETVPTSYKNKCMTCFYLKHCDKSPLRRMG